LALTFDAEMGTGLLECSPHPPAGNKPLKDFLRRGIEIGAEERVRVVFPERIADQHPADGHLRNATVIPDRGSVTILWTVEYRGRVQTMVPSRGRRLPLALCNPQLADSEPRRFSRVLPRPASRTIHIDQHMLASPHGNGRNER
jgi:hypothetical protein